MIIRRKLIPKAFTLVELLVVIAIVGLIAAISIIALNSARAKSRDAKRAADIKQISTALALFFNDAGRYPDDLEWASGSLEYNGQTYLAVIPSAPSPADGSCDGATNQFSYTQDDNGASYTITFCTGGVVGALAGGELCATPSGMNSCNVGGGGGVAACSGSTSCGDTCSYGGEDYPTVSINGQCWFAKNLNIGTMVPGVNNQTNDGIMEKYCYNDNSADCTTYGGLYQWDEVMQYSVSEGAQGVCPSGWHVPTDAEQHALDDYLKDPGQDCNPNRNHLSYPWGWECDTAGTKLKLGGSSGFEGLFAGYRDAGNGSFALQENSGLFWSSLSNGASAWRRHLDSSSLVARAYNDQNFGFSVRCIQD